VIATNAENGNLTAVPNGRQVRGRHQAEAVEVGKRQCSPRDLEGVTERQRQ